jgi:hypothetical protein
MQFVNEQGSTKKNQRELFDLIHGFSNAISHVGYEMPEISRIFGSPRM